MVLADRSIALSPDVDLVGRLREDPLTDFVPVVLLLPAGEPVDRIAVRSAGAEDALTKPRSAAPAARGGARGPARRAGGRVHPHR
ncbi:MAG: hypothetical protein M5U28_28475 [Sandaracinaceae bacterium]|nr:hypothetical protein [Sandaracinaceae bacterium]